MFWYDTIMASFWNMFSKIELLVSGAMEWT
jgi:hypothetical protein